jgi:hypothetical protein
MGFVYLLRNLVSLRDRAGIGKNGVCTRFLTFGAYNLGMLFFPKAWVGSLERASKTEYIWGDLRFLPDMARARSIAISGQPKQWGHAAHPHLLQCTCAHYHSMPIWC